MEIEIPNQFERALRVIHDRLAELGHPWGITGSLGMRLQGMPLEMHDIDLQSDRPGAYAIQERLAASAACRLLQPVAFRTSRRIRSHFGQLEIAGVKVEVMGDIANLLVDDTWSTPPDLPQVLRWVAFAGMELPVLDLQYEQAAYRQMERLERAAQIQRFLEQQQP